LENLKKTYPTFLITGLVALLIYVFNDGSDYIKLSYIITFYLAARLVQQLGSKVPFADLVLVITAIQYLLSPALDYQYLGKYNPYFHMRIPQETYFSYVLYAFIGLWIGFSIPLGRKPRDIEFINALRKCPKMNAQIGVHLIVIGFAAYYANKFINFPAALNFTITLLALMRFIGVLFIWLSDHQNKKWIIGAVLLEFVLYTFSDAILIQLIIMAIFLYSYYTLVHKPKKIKIVLLSTVALVLLFFVQSIKKDYRDVIWKQNSQSDKIGIFSGLLFDKIENMDETSFLFTAASVNLRINQGWVMQLIMSYLPNKKPFLNGEVLEDEIIGLVLPRFILIDKAAVQTAEKFEKFVGYRIRGYTIAMGVLGDGYGNFGVEGGIIFCFLVGLFYNFCIFIFYKLSQSIPSVYLWGILIFFYLIRAGDDFYIISNWIIKAAMLLALVYFMFKRQLVTAYQKVKLRRKPVFEDLHALHKPSL
jgi:hypothetical protein